MLVFVLVLATGLGAELDVLALLGALLAVVVVAAAAVAARPRRLGALQQEAEVQCGQKV